MLTKTACERRGLALGALLRIATLNRNVLTVAMKVTDKAAMAWSLLRLHSEGWDGDGGADSPISAGVKR